MSNLFYVSKLRADFVSSIEVAVLFEWRHSTPFRDAQFVVKRYELEEGKDRERYSKNFGFEIMVAD